MAAPSTRPGRKDCSPIVRLDAVVKRFGLSTVLDGVDLDVDEGEFFTLLGPSGSGKTTLLRLISGFDRPDSGTIRLDGVDVANTPAHLRDVNTVFQDYALFPHMSVLENIAYGPLAKKVSKIEAIDRAKAALETVKLAHVADRRPGQLSGGQRQRIAMARAIVNRPRVLLLDEPLGALDLQLRHEMQGELQRFQRELGITFIYVTHDQEEALAMSDRIAVFDRGRIAQIGTPVDLYERPASPFVAAFVGVSNVLKHGGAAVMIRPERVRLHREPPSQIFTNTSSARVAEVTFLGMTTRYLLSLENGRQVQAVELNTGDSPSGPFRCGEDLWVSWRDIDMVHLGS